MEKNEVFNSLFASVFIYNLFPHLSRPVIGEDHVQNVRNPNIHKSVGLIRMGLGVLRELADVVANLCSIIFEKSWHSKSQVDGEK